MMNIMKFMEKRDKEVIQREESLKLVALAFEEWKEREEFFEAVEEPELVDYAIYQMEASRLKYIYLLNKLRKEVEREEDNEERSSLNLG